MTVSGLRESRERLLTLAARAEDVRPAWRHTQRLLERQASDTFKTEGTRLGDAWARWTPRYRRRKPGTVLRLSGSLRTSLVSPRGRYVLRIVGRDSFRYGTKHPLAHLHHTGGRRGGLPARPLVGLPPDTREAIVASVRDHLAGRRMTQP